MDRMTRIKSEIIYLLHPVHPCKLLMLLRLICIVVLCCSVAAAQKKAPASKAKPAATPAAEVAAEAAPEDEAALNAELEEIKKIGVVADRIPRLEAFLAAHPQSLARLRAAELLTGARAALGDERLRAGDRVGGVELFTQIVDSIGPETSEGLFNGIIARLPANLYLLGHREEALALARRIEEKSAASARRLLIVTAFYLGAESPDDAARSASAAARVAPEMAAAHQALGSAYRQALKLEEAAEAFAAALRLNPSDPASRRGLADLRRATGRSEEALALYREQLAADPKDAGARAGYVLSLFEAGRREEGEAELRKASEEQPENLQLLVGAAFYFAAEGDGPRALEWADRAVRLEPRVRWVWARLAYARALMAGKRALDAEMAVRLASELGRFPTLDYELASALSAAGLYDEAAEELTRSFSLDRDGRLVTRLAGRTEAHAADFRELLAAERRASIFQHRPVDSAAEARRLKALLAFRRAAGALGGKPDEAAAVEAGREFVAGDDEMRAFRQLYVAARLLERGAALPFVIERTDEAMGGVEAALDSPSVVVALLADELHDGRVRARASGVKLDVPEVPRELLSKIIRGRIEDLAGWALYMQGGHADAAVRLKRAVSVLPEGSYWWRSAQWHLGAALDASGNPREALNAYARTYRLEPTQARRGIIEELYQRLNGSTQGLERFLSADTESAAAAAPTPTPRRTLAARPPTPDLTPLQQAQAAGIAAVTPAPTPTPDAATTNAAAQETPKQSSEETQAPAQTVKEEPTPTTQAAPAPTPAVSETPTQTTPTQVAETQATPAPASTPTPEQTARAGSVTSGVGACALTFSPAPLSLASGGTASLSVTSEAGADLSKLSATTPNWADILVFAEPRAADSPAARFTVSTVSGKPGTYTLVFKLPCGTSELQVEVK